MTSTTYEARNALGVLLHTFGDVELAKRWVEANGYLHAGLHIEEVTVTVTRRRIGRQLFLVAAR